MSWVLELALLTRFFLLIQKDSTRVLNEEFLNPPFSNIFSNGLVLFRRKSMRYDSDYIHDEKTLLRINNRLTWILAVYIFIRREGIPFIYQCLHNRFFSLLLRNDRNWILVYLLVYSPLGIG